MAGIPYADQMKKPPGFVSDLFPSIIPALKPPAGKPAVQKLPVGKYPTDPKTMAPEGISALPEYSDSVEIQGPGVSSGPPVKVEQPFKEVTQTGEPLNYPRQWNGEPIDLNPPDRSMSDILKDVQPGISALPDRTKDTGPATAQPGISALPGGTMRETLPDGSFRHFAPQAPKPFIEGINPATGRYGPGLGSVVPEGRFKSGGDVIDVKYVNGVPTFSGGRGNRPNTPAEDDEEAKRAKDQEIKDQDYLRNKRIEDSIAAQTSAAKGIDKLSPEKRLSLMESFKGNAAQTENQRSQIEATRKNLEFNLETRGLAQKEAAAEKEKEKEKAKAKAVQADKEKEDFRRASAQHKDLVKELGVLNTQLGGMGSIKSLAEKGDPKRLNAKVGLEKEIREKGKKKERLETGYLNTLVDKYALGGNQVTEIE